MRLSDREYCEIRLGMFCLQKRFDLNHSSRRNEYSQMDKTGEKWLCERSSMKCCRSPSGMHDLIQSVRCRGFASR